MALRIGIDTGGTFTDAVILDTEKGIVCSNKALTTYDDLFVGINEAVSGLLDNNEITYNSISMIGLSTTLATNAIVENHGRSACLVLIGQPKHVINNQQLKKAIGDDSIIQVQGGHKANGEENNPLDLTSLKEQIENRPASVSGFAIASFFSVRNPNHELQAKSLIASMTGLPVTCSHELTSKLDAPKRALTCLFNARLIPLLTSLISSIKKLLEQKAINAPLMVVQGDGSLVYAPHALNRPVETILSGPAASIHGARYLSHIEDAIVSDIGGTTTDVAMLEDSTPTLNLNGAYVGGFQTMVEAVNVNTCGLGGDSEVLLNLGKPILSRQRAIPICQLLHRYPKLKETLIEQLKNPPREMDGRFAVKLLNNIADNQFLSTSEKRIYNLLDDGPKSLGVLLESPAFERAMYRLRKRGIINLSAFTPTDALHIMGDFNKWDKNDSENTAKLFCRLIERYTNVAITTEELSKHVIDLVIDKTKIILLQTTLLHTYNEKGFDRDMDAKRLSEIMISQPENIFFDSRIKFKQPIIAIGAPAKMFYDKVAEFFKTTCIVPEYAHVCNAVGAAMSLVIQKHSVLITSPSEGVFRVHASDNITDFEEFDKAFQFAKDNCEQTALRSAKNAGAKNIKTKLSDKKVFIDGPGDYKLFIEAKITAVAEGEPSVMDV